MSRNRYDEEEIISAPGRTPAPRPTLVGVGARNGDTPPSMAAISRIPTPPSGIPAQLARGDTAIILERLNSIDSKVDRLAKSHDGQRRELRVLRLYMTRVAKEAATKSEVGGLAVEVGRSVGAIAALERDLGKPPEHLEARASQTDHTAAELVALERGSGYAGVLGRLVAGQSRLLRRVGIVALVATTVPQIALVALAAGFGAWVLGGVIVLIAAAALTILVRRARSRTRRSS